MQDISPLAQVIESFWTGKRHGLNRVKFFFDIINVRVTFLDANGPIK